MITRRVIEAMQAGQVGVWTAERYKPDTHPQEAYTISYCGKPLCGVATVEGYDTFMIVGWHDEDVIRNVVAQCIKTLEPKDED
jgi:hypothetical protein